MKRKKFTLLLLVILAVLGSLTAAQAQTTAADTRPAVHTKTLWEQIRQGGWVMYPIGACSILTLYLVGDGVIKTGRKKVMPEPHITAIQSFFRQGDYVGAYNYCRANSSPFTNVCRVAVSLLGEGKQAVEEGMIGELAKENSFMQTHISYLSVIGVCAPMIGLLGTVTGMIKAFGALATGALGDPTGLSEAIGEVLVATASGLFIAIPAFGFFYFLRNRASRALHEIQDTMAGLFRKMPYEHLAGAHIGDEEIYAAAPNWLALSETGEVTA